MWPSRSFGTTAAVPDSAARAPNRHPADRIRCACSLRPSIRAVDLDDEYLAHGDVEPTRHCRQRCPQRRLDPARRGLTATPRGRHSRPAMRGTHDRRGGARGDRSRRNGGACPCVSTPPVTPTVVLVVLVMPYLFRSSVRWAHAAVGIGGQASDGRLLRRLVKGHARPVAQRRPPPGRRIDRPRARTQARGHRQGSRREHAPTT